MKNAVEMGSVEMLKEEAISEKAIHVYVSKQDGYLCMLQLHGYHFI